MEKSNPAIIVIAYNRKRALMRLLDSINRAEYPSNDIQLVISVDKSDSDETIKAARGFSFNHGQVRIIEHEKNMGLKKHVLSCGDLTAEYGSVILLEDDLIVSPQFYCYTVSALDFVAADKRVAGVSLYNHRLNVHVRRPFEAMEDGYDNYYFQFASSWGQAFTEKQWEGFKKYLADYGDREVADVSVPKFVSSWSDKSWLKHYIRYMIDNDLYFIYPRVSLTTNFSEEGEHAVSTNDDLQVPLLYGKKDWRLSSLDEATAIYDAFFENVRVSKDRLDLYGYKQITDDIDKLISTKALPYKVIESYGLHLRPHEMNVALKMPGNDIFLYDVKTSSEPPKYNEARIRMYDYRAFKVSHGIKIAKARLFKR